MAQSGPRIVVVGGGIIGVMITWQLAKRGGQVTLIEKRASVAAETTQKSFGWVGVGADHPAANPALYALRLRAIADYARLRQELGAAFPAITTGALEWKSTPADTKSLVTAHSDAGANATLLNRAQIAAKEPALLSPPENAAYFPDDFALDPSALCHALLADAPPKCARLSVSAQSLDIQNGTLRAVATDAGIQPADIVILANGTSLNMLANTLGASVPMQYAPAVLLRFKPCQALPRHIVCAPDLEIRQMPDGTLLVAEDMPPNGPTGLRHLGNTVAHRIAQTFAADTPPQLYSIEIGNRPYPADGLPFVAALPQTSGVFAAVAHPGVALAPYVAQACADLVLGPAH